MTETKFSDTVAVEHLRALNRAWCIDGGNEIGSAVVDTDAGIGTMSMIRDNDKYRHDQRGKQTETSAPLEIARIAISKLSPATSSSLAGTTITNVSIVPYVFSVLSEQDDENKETNEEKNSSSSSETTTPGTNKDVTNKYELKQIEWHIVLLLELWACTLQSTNNEGNSSKSKVLDKISFSILSYRDQLRRKNTITNIKKKKNRKKHKKKPNDLEASAENMSEREKEKLFLDHLAQIISRVPFLLRRDVPVSEFLIERIMSRERLFWERLHHIVSHIFETFEISNPYLSKLKGDDSIMEESLLLSSIPDKKRDESGEYKLLGGKKKHVEATTGQKRKPSKEKLQAIAKNKKRQRLASLTSKRKHRGSHFHRNLDDISKLLEKNNKTKTLLSSNTRGKMIGTNSDDGTTATLNRKKASGNSHHSEKVDLSVRKRIDNRKNNKYINRVNALTEVKRGEDIQPRGQLKKPSRSKETRQNNAMKILSTDLVDIILEKKKKNNDHKTNVNGNNNNESNGSSDMESIPMTPRKAFRSDAVQIIGESPVPRGSGMRFNAVVGETPVAGNGSWMPETIAGETPTHENNFVTTPISSSSAYHYFSPPALPSPAKLPTAPSTEATTIHSKQPVKLFGAVKLKRRNIIGSRGKMKSWDTTVKDRAANSVVAKAPSAAENYRQNRGKDSGASSIDKARAFLRSKTL